jgi:uncharacterized membrane protein YjgN (DUF898 family)
LFISFVVVIRLENSEKENPVKCCLLEYALIIAAIFQLKIVYNSSSRYHSVQFDFCSSPSHSFFLSLSLSLARSVSIVIYVNYHEEQQ